MCPIIVHIYLCVFDVCVCALSEVRMEYVLCDVCIEGNMLCAICLCCVVHYEAEMSLVFNLRACVCVCVGQDTLLICLVQG